MKRIDLNCDMGESFGAWKMGDDAAIMPYVTSANIACGFHAGDAHTMRHTMQLALQQGVRPGAHPGLDDIRGFGRRPFALTPIQVYDLVVVQIGALAAVARAQGGRLYHVKAHGALYNMSANHAELAAAIAQAVRDVDPQLTLFALAGSHQVDIARGLGLTVMQEVFADRSYQDDGTLTPRNQPGALIEEVETSVAQALTMVQEGYVIAQSGKKVPIQADTLCLHGDGAHALSFARQIHAVFQKEGLLMAH